MIHPPTQTECGTMRIYHKILLTTLPLGFVILVAMGTVYTLFSEKALMDLATTWLETRVFEAIQMAEHQNENLKKYGLEEIKASILKAKLDATKQISQIAVGKEGYVFIVDHRGTIVFNPDQILIGHSVAGEPWFQKLKQKKGTISYTQEGSEKLAFYGYFAPWEWFIIAADPHKEFLGAAQRIKPIMTGLGILGGMTMAVLLMVFTHRITRPLAQLTEGTRQVGEGNLKTLIEVDSNDELGALADDFNAMTQRLQEITISRDELEEVVQERTRELTETNKRLARTERFAAAGQLATTVAHEINSPLQGIFSMVELMKETLTDRPDDVEDLEAIETGLKAIKKTVRNLMDLNRPNSLERTEIHINHIIQNTLSLFHTQVAKRGGTIKMNLAPDLPQIFASPQLLSHVFINFINNSLEALAEEEEERDAYTKPKVPDIKISTTLHLGTIVIAFQDNGPGISDAVMKKLFTPFFTTKKQLGMGVGLTICNESIQEHGGTLNAGNAPEGGAVFTIHLPTQTDKSAAEPDPAETVSPDHHKA